VYLDGPGFRLADHFLKEKPDGSKPATGGQWLCEHAVSGYVPAWHTPLGNACGDEAIATTGLSRWHNYYLEGLRWLIETVGIDGLYLDGIGFDREIMVRLRKVMERARPGCLIDFHSGNNFHPEYGLNSCANQYLELFPCIDSAVGELKISRQSTVDSKDDDGKDDDGKDDDGKQKSFGFEFVTVNCELLTFLQTRPRRGGGSRGRSTEGWRPKPRRRMAPEASPGAGASRTAKEFPSPSTRAFRVT
jgi:hypothetical protein